MVVQITSPKFCAALVVENDGVVETAPILKGFRLCSWRAVQLHCRNKGWKIEILKVEKSMAYGRSNKGSRPTHYIAVTAKVGKGRYEKGPYIGLWEGEDDDGPLFRGSAQGKYLDEL